MNKTNEAIKKCYLKFKTYKYSIAEIVFILYWLDIPFL